MLQMQTIQLSMPVDALDAEAVDHCTLDSIVVISSQMLNTQRLICYLCSYKLTHTGLNIKGDILQTKHHPTPKVIFILIYIYIYIYILRHNEQDRQCDKPEIHDSF